MAIIINKESTISGGITINSIYLRIEYHADLSGKSFICKAHPYYNKIAFNSNYQENVLKIDDLPRNFEFSYNTADGDPLIFIHNKIKSVLSTNLTKAIDLLDPSTGIPMFDVSTGVPLYEYLIVTNKFAQDSSILFSDLD